MHAVHWSLDKGLENRYYRNIRKSDGDTIMSSRDPNGRHKKWGAVQWGTFAGIISATVALLTYFGIFLTSDRTEESQNGYISPPNHSTTASTRTASSQSTATTPPTKTTQKAPSGPTRAQYITQANAVCAEASARVGELGPISPDDPWAEQKRIQDLREINVIYRRMEADLRSLPSPSGDEPKLDRMYILLDNWLNDWPRWVDLQEAQDPRHVAAGEKLAIGIQRFQQAAQAYGLARCASLGP